MRKSLSFLFLVFCFFLSLGVTNATFIPWDSPKIVNNLGLFAPKMPEQVEVFMPWYYEDKIKTFSIWKINESGNDKGEVFLIFLNQQPYRWQEKLYIYRTGDKNVIIGDISDKIDQRWFMKTPSYIKSEKISWELGNIALPANIWNSNLRWYSFIALPKDEKNPYDFEKYEKAGTFFNSISRKYEPLYTQIGTGSMNGFYVKRFDGFMSLYAPHLSFLRHSSSIIWDDGVKRRSEYRESDGVSCWNFAHSLLKIARGDIPVPVWVDAVWPKIEEIPFREEELLKVGKTPLGSIIYTLPDTDTVYATYYEKYFPKGISNIKKRWLAEFIQSKPFVFYKDSLGRYIVLMNIAYYSPMQCA